MTVHHLRPAIQDDEPDLTPPERALHTVRLAAFRALDMGATRQDIDREVAEAIRVHIRTTIGGPQR